MELSRQYPQIQFRLIGPPGFRWLIPEGDELPDGQEQTEPDWLPILLRKKPMEILLYMLVSGLPQGSVCTREAIRRDCWNQDDDEPTIDTSKDRQITETLSWLKRELARMEGLDKACLNSDGNACHIIDAGHKTDLGYFYAAVKAAQRAFKGQRYQECHDILNTWKVPMLRLEKYGHLDLIWNAPGSQPVCLPGIRREWADIERAEFEEKCNQARQMLQDCTDHTSKPESAVSLPELVRTTKSVIENTPSVTRPVTAVSMPANVIRDGVRPRPEPEATRKNAAGFLKTWSRQMRSFAIGCVSVVLAIVLATVLHSQTPARLSNSSVPIRTVEPWQDLHTLVPMQQPEGVDVPDLKATKKAYEQTKETRIKQVAWFVSDTNVQPPLGQWRLHVRMKALEPDQPPILKADMVMPAERNTTDPTDATGCKSDELCRRWVVDRSDFQGALSLSKIQLIAAFGITASRTEKRFSKPVCQYWFEKDEK